MEVLSMVKTLMDVQWGIGAAKLLRLFVNNYGMGSTTITLIWVSGC